MAVILRNEFGVVAVNRQVVTKLILDEMLAMEGELLPCTKSGKPLKKSRFSGYGDMTDAIERFVDLYHGISFEERVVLTYSSVLYSCFGRHTCLFCEKM